MTIAASRGYEDWFNYTDQPTLASIAQMGWGTFLGFRVDALLKGLGVILINDFSVRFDWTPDRLAAP